MRRDPGCHPTMAVHIVDLRNVSDVRALSMAIATDEERIKRLLDGDRSVLQRHVIPKRDPTKGNREVWEIVDTALLDGVRALSHRLHDFAVDQKKGYPHPAAHAYLKDRSIVTNARVHIGANRLLRADIRDFFGSIGTQRVEAFLLEWRFKPVAASLLAAFCTLDNALPLGFPTSPVFANLICTSLDVDLEAVAARYSCRYTRYADDLAFSGESGTPSRIELASILDRHKFTLSDNKFREAKRGQAFFVTGLSISEKDKPRVPRRFKKRLRQELFYIRKYGLFSHLGARGYSTYQSGINKIDGSLRYMQGVERDLALQMRADWYAELQKAGVSVTHISKGGAPLARVGIFIDESEPEKSGLLLVGGVLVEDLDHVRAKLSDFLAEKIGDPFTAGRKSTLVKKGLHWADVHQDVKSELVAFISRLPFRAYVAFNALTDPSIYATMYLELSKALLKRRFVALDNRIVDVVVEQNGKVSQNRVKDLIEDIEQSLAARSSRRPHSWTYTTVQKLAEPCLALADIVLAVFGDYMTKKPGMGTQLALRYERIKSKIRVIESLADHKVYTRRTPFTF